MRTLWGARFVLGGVALGVALLALAMHLYPGGTALDTHAPGHSFWLNFLCDLASPTARNGVANPVGSLCARAAMTSFSLALGATWWLVPAFLADRPRSAHAIRVAGSLNALCLLVVPRAGGIAHVTATFTSAGAGLTAGLITFAALVGSGGPTRRWLLLAATLATTAADAFFYARSVATSPRVVLPALPIFQRLAFGLALAWMMSISFELIARSRGPARAKQTAAASRS